MLKDNGWQLSLQRSASFPIFKLPIEILRASSPSLEHRMIGLNFLSGFHMFAPTEDL